MAAVARIADDNLEQVNCLVEWPSAVACDFEDGFLAVPQEALVATMEANQKFFPVLDAAGRLTHRFHRHRQHRIQGRRRRSARATNA
jgi:glycyl-tRNA synthetase beta chain